MPILPGSAAIGSRSGSATAVPCTAIHGTTAPRPRHTRHTRGNRVLPLALGRSHDRATALLAVPFGLLWWPWLGPQIAAIAGVSFLLGGLWLSPDLDTVSRPLVRWGPLRWLWWPYRRLLSHRSLFSHGPLLGSALRLLYLLALVLALCLVGRPLGLPSPGALLEQLKALALARPTPFLAAFSGLEASAWLHLIQDGDPLPRVPRPLRPLVSRRRRRRRR